LFFDPRASLLPAEDALDLSLDETGLKMPWIPALVERVSQFGRRATRSTVSYSMSIPISMLLRIAVFFSRLEAV
jgi:hypothetical protein